MSKPSEGKCGLTNMADWTDIGCSCYDFINDPSFDSQKKKRTFTHLGVGGHRK